MSGILLIKNNVNPRQRWYTKEFQWYSRIHRVLPEMVEIRGNVITNAIFSKPIER